LWTPCDQGQKKTSAGAWLFFKRPDKNLGQQQNVSDPPNISYFFLISTYLGWLFEREQFPRDLLILVHLEAASISDPEDSGIGKIARGHWHR
jgi:hypothetical protein